MIKRLRIWWLMREFDHNLQGLRFYIERSAFDLRISTHEHRHECIARRAKIRALATSLKDLGVDVSGKGEQYQWR